MTEEGDTRKLGLLRIPRRIQRPADRGRPRGARRRDPHPAHGRVSRSPRARVPHQCRRGALLQVGQGLRLSLPAVLARELGGSRGGHPGADHRGADPRHATGAHDLRLARQEPHLPPLRGTDGLERAALAQPGPEERAELLKRLDEVERTVITAKMPGSVADQLYVLRQHITWVRERLAAGAAAPS